MAVAIRHTDFPEGIGTNMYDRVNAEMDIASDPPDGLIFHWAGEVTANGPSRTSGKRVTRMTASRRSGYSRRSRRSPAWIRPAVHRRRSPSSRSTTTSSPSAAAEMATTGAQTGYAPIGDLNMYYEIHGRGRPLILLHGAYMTIDAMGPILPGLAKTMQVIAVEQQGHGRTADADRPITYERMADDTAALARHLGIENADVVGYSMGGGIALQVAIRHPDLVRKLVVASTSFRSDGMHAAALEMFPSITPELFAGTPIEEAYLRTAPNPGDFPKLVEKLKQLDTTPFAWPERDIQAIARAHPDRLGRLRRRPPRARGPVLRAARRRGDG
jgi:pimeloyl-ACP methyl ester carboxylesterase